MMRERKMLQRVLKNGLVLGAMTSALASALLITPAKAEWRINPEAEPALSTVIYTCDSGQKIVVRYDNSDPAAPSALLKYKDRTFDLYNVISASGARYATEQGLSEDKGLQWWTKGGSATLSEMLMDHTAPDPVAIESCNSTPSK